MINKSVMPRGIFFFPPAASTERLAHNSTPEAARDAVSCSRVQPAVCVHTCQQRDLNLGAAGVGEARELNHGRLLPGAGEERIRVKLVLKKETPLVSFP